MVNFKTDYKVGDNVRVVDIDTMVKRGGVYKKEFNRVHFQDISFVEAMIPYIGSEFTIDCIVKNGIVEKWTWHFIPEMLELVEAESSHNHEFDVKHVAINSKEEKFVDAYRLGKQLLELHKTMTEKGFEVDIYDGELHISINDVNTYINIK